MTEDYRLKLINKNNERGDFNVIVKETDFNYDFITEEELGLCDKAIKGELLGVDDINEVMHEFLEHISDWGNRPENKGFDVGSLKVKLKQYMLSKVNYNKKK